MIRLNNLKLSLSHSLNELNELIIEKLKIRANDLKKFEIIKRSVDARNKNNIKIVYSVDALVVSQAKILRSFSKDKNIFKAPDLNYRFVVRAPKDISEKVLFRPVVVGAGPCGYFAALLLAQMGFKPLLLERGKPVKERTFDTYGFWKGTKPFNPESNVQFGEGGAGTFSDGKLYSQVSDPENYGRKVLEELVDSGANENILVMNRPHIGTFKLATVVRGLRAKIKKLGGEISFESRMDELLIRSTDQNDSSDKPLEVVGIKLSDGRIIKTNYLIIALGHSSRDSFNMLEKAGVDLRQKLFSVGFRIEHPQQSVDLAKFGKSVSHSELGHAEYKLVHHASNGRCVYSFCMCPGGTVVGSTSEKNCVVTNGMSEFSRNKINANSALVVNLIEDDFKKYERWYKDPLAGIALQRDLEYKAFKLAGSNYFAPAQKIEDFLSGKVSTSLGTVKPSYRPGIRFCDLNDLLPPPLLFSIREALPIFNKKFSFFYHPDAILTAIETRTSSPVRIIRDSNFESVNTKGLFPGGEGAGYAGGILSAGIDGIKVAEKMAKMIVSDCLEKGK